MQYKDTKLHNLLRKEVALKGNSSSIFFIAFAIFTIVYGYGIQEHDSIIKIVSLLIIINAIFRFFYQKKILNVNIVTDKEWYVLRSTIWINAFLFGLVVNIISYELKLSGTHFIVLTTFLSGIIGASIVTLSYYPSLFLPFQLLLMIPQIGLIIYFYFTEHINQIPLIFLYIAYLAYQLIQFKRYRREIIRLFEYQIELESINKELHDKKNELLKQNMTIMHTSRLAALGELSASIAHEINNPINIIQNSNKFILKNIKNNEITMDLVEKNSEKIERASDRVLKISDTLRILASQSESIPKEYCPLESIIEDTKSLCQEYLISKNIVLEIEEIPAIDIFCHHVQITQVLINIVKNATDFLKDQSLEVDEKKWINISFIKQNEVLTIVIKNNGPKMSDEIKDRIFDPFFTTKPSKEGTGLGLSISKKIIEEHNGNLHVDLSDLHTKFFVSLKVN